MFMMNIDVFLQEGFSQYSGFEFDANKNEQNPKSTVLNNRKSNTFRLDGWMILLLRNFWPRMKSRDES